MATPDTPLPAPSRLLPPLPGGRRSTLLLFRQSLRSAWRGMAAHALRSALSVLAIVVGTLGVFAVTASAQGTRSSLVGQFAALQAQLVSVNGWAGGPQQNVQSPPSLTAADLAAIERLPHVVAVNTAIGVGGRGDLVAGNRSWQVDSDGGIEGELPGAQKIYGFTLQSGTFFSEQDVQTLATNAVLGATVAQGLFPNGNAVGQQVRLLHVNFTVTGVLAPLGGVDGRNLDNRIFLPVTTLMQKVIGPIKGAKGPPPGAPANFNLIFINLPEFQVMADAVATVPTVQREITTTLEQTHHLATGQPDDFSVGAFTQGAKAAQQSLATVEIVSAITAIVAMLLGGFGVANVLLAAVSERTREIGLRLAVGAEPADIRRQFLIEAVTIALLGGLTGSALGLVLVANVAKLFGGPGGGPAPTPVTIGGALAAALLLGLLFGSYPAQRAARLDPIQALRRG